MSVLNELLGSSGLDLGQLSQRFGLNAAQTNAALRALVPSVVGGLQQKVQNSDSAPITAGVAGDVDTNAGNAILAQIFGTKEVSRQVADQAAGQAGVPSTIVKAMLPIVAGMVAKHFAANAGSGQGGLLGSLAGMAENGGTAGPAGGVLGSLLSELKR